MHNVWMLMGKAQFGKEDYTAAAATFIYTARLYQNRPEIAAEANIRLAACYIGTRQLYEAEEVLGRLNRLTLTKRLTRMRSAANDSLAAARRREERLTATNADTTTTPLPHIRQSSPLQMEDSLYSTAYDAYRAKNYRLADSCAVVSAQRYATGRHRAKFIYLQAMSDLQMGQKDRFIELMRELVRNYPDGEISEIASAILKGVDEGRPLLGAAPQGSNIWSRSNRTATGDTTELSATDTIPHFTAKHSGRHLFVIAYPTGAISRNMLLYEVARFNFSTFLVKEFDMEFSTADGIERMEIGWFANLEEANYYNYKLNSSKELSDMLKNAHTLIISEKNYEILNKYYSFDDYAEFYSSTLDDTDDSAGGKSMDDPLNNLPDEEEDEEDDDSDTVDPQDSNNKTIYIY
jgi:TolA-binding protein